MSQDTARHQQVNIGEHEEVSNAKRVLPVGSTGDIIHPATEEKQDILSAYAPAGQDISSDPMYFAGLKADGSWYIKRMYLSGDYTTKYANGSSGFDWSTRASLSYADFNTLTW